MAKAWKIPDFSISQRTHAALSIILQTRLVETFSYEAGTREGGDIEALHDMRVATRRVQAMMKIFRTCFHQKKFRRHYRQVRQLLRALGAVRDCDVLIKTLNDYRSHLAERDGLAIALVVARQQRIREERRKDLHIALDSLAAGRFQENFMRFVAEEL